ncbi:hypothetical protein GCM10010191_32660 [Actinomadura vinacea]|uniref:Exo-alpha-sialidase n=1 Tax=Actinomadura vinacea TaxID=115336 RepID=A0ABP5W3T6_9ACTN
MTARTPEQDDARLLAGAEPPAGDELSGPRGSRQIRRRLTFRPAEALREPPESREARAPGKRGKKGPSPWQRAQEAWRNAGVPWSDADAGEAADTRPPASPEAKAGAKDRSKQKGERAPAAATATEAARPPAEPKSKDGDKTKKKGKSALAGAAAPEAPRPPAEPKARTAKDENEDKGESAVAGAATADPRPPAGGKDQDKGKRKKKGEPALAGAAKSAATTDAAAEASAPAVPKPRSAGEGGAAAPRREVGLRRPSHKAVALGVGAVVAAGAVGYALTGDADEDVVRSAVAAAKPAEGWFVADPAAKADGLVQDLSTVAASGRTVVATGTETVGDGTPGRERAEFLVSLDAGRTWRLAEVHTPDGETPAPGAKPRLLAGGAGAWTAIGQTADARVAVWTSVDGRSWTNETAAVSAFGPNDRVNALVRTSSGFVAAGVASSAGADPRAVVWTSADGRAWQRADRLNLPDMAGIGGLAASGDTVVAHGSFSRKVTKTVKRKGKKKGTQQVAQTVRGEAMWRSADGGRTWAAVNVPQGQGAYGPAKGLTAGPGGFYLAREGQRTTGPKKKRKTSRYGVVFASRDGAAWAPTAQLSVPEYTVLERLTGTGAGLAALVRGKGNVGTVLRGGGGSTWRATGEVGAPGPGSAISGMAVADGGGAVVTGRRGEDGFMALAGAPGPVAPVDLTKVPGAVRAERTLAACASDPSGRLVVVGSTGGDAATWTAAGQAGWTRGRAPDFGAGRAGGPGQGRQRLTDVAHGPRGWLAVGRTDAPSGGASTPLVLASQDGTTWRRAGFPGGKTTSGVAAGPDGYVVVGMVGGSAAAWRSTDLKAWTRGGNAGKGDLDGPTWMRDVAATAKGYAAVGGRRGAAKPGQNGAKPVPPGDLPAIWTSADGRKWTAVPSPALPPGIASGAFFQVAARGDALVALGWGRTAATANAPGRAAAFVAHSSDGGRTWRTSVPEGAGETTELTAVTATPKAFLLAGTTGGPGRRNVALWKSPSGAEGWNRVRAFGAGLDGRGDQRLTALTAVGNQVVGTGVSADHRGETPMLWRTPAP